MNTDTDIKVLCDQNDPNIDAIAARMSVLRKAIQSDSLVAVACKDTRDETDAVLLAVMTVEEGSDLAQYAPIAQLYYPEDTHYTAFTPPKAATKSKETDG